MIHFIFSFFLAAFAVMSSPVYADELMNLYPTSRELHQKKMNENADSYLLRGHDYVDHMYATGGEEDMPLMGDDLVSEDNVMPVNTDDVARYVGQSKALSMPKLRDY